MPHTSVRPIKDLIIRLEIVSRSPQAHCRDIISILLTHACTWSVTYSTDVKLKIATTLPGSLILPPPGASEERPWLGLVRATLTTENIREGSSLIREFFALSLVALRPPLTAMFNNSLLAEISKSIYSDVNLKVRQVCFETIYRGRDVVAVVPIGFMESRSYFNCGRRAAQFYSEVIVILALLFLL